MFSEITVKDMIGTITPKVEFNEVVITRRDVISLPKLMIYLSNNKYHIEDELRLDSFPQRIQNGIGLIFLEEHGYIIYLNGQKYLNASKIYTALQEHEILKGYLDRVKVASPTHLENTLDISAFYNSEFNEILLTWFSKIYRNFQSIYKDIPKQETLMDVNMNKGYFNKIVNPTEFLVTMFSRYLRIQKGSIPFSQNFGSTIKASLQRKADFFTQQILIEEVQGFIVDLSTIYNDSFTLVDVEYKEVVSDAVHLTIYITLQINDDEPLVINIAQ